MKRRLLIDGIVPAAVLIAAVFDGLFCDDSVRVLENLEFARPLVSFVKTNSVTVTRVAHGSHYESHGSLAASIETRLGYVVVVQFDSEDAARAGFSELRKSCCTPFYETLDSTRLIFTAEPSLDRLVKAILPKNR